MLYGQDRDQSRRFFLQCWRKARDNAPLEPLEHLVAEVIGAHPEYHALLEDEAQAMAWEPPAGGAGINPFLHMGLHLAIREQLQADRPPGIRAHYQRLLRHAGDPHQVEHRIMECLGQALWDAQRRRRAPDETAYLDCIRALTSGG